MRSILVALLAIGVGCGTDTPPPTPMFTELVGDWFLCDAPDCSVLRNHGAHWDSDGTWVMLEARGAQTLEPTATYCSSQHDANRGPYLFDVATGALDMTDDLGRDAGGGTMTFTAPTATLTTATGTSSVYLRIDPPRLSGPCPITL